MSRAKLSERLNRLLPGEQWKRVREGILAAASYSGQRTDQLRQRIDEDNRLKTGRLVDGTVTFTSTTTADLSGFAWVVDDVIRQQTGTESITVDAPDADFPRTDIFVGLADGSIAYRAGTVDAEGNGQDPNYTAATEVLLRAVTRNPDNSNDDIDTGDSSSDFVSKTVTGTQRIASNLEIGQQADANAIPVRAAALSKNGLVYASEVDQVGTRTTLSGSSDWSRLIRVDATVNNQLDYKVSANFTGVNSQNGSLWIEFTLDSSGDMVSHNLQLFGDFTASRFKMVKIASFIYDIFVEHTETADFFKWRPTFSFGSSDKYTYYHQETLGALPAGDEYGFTTYIPSHFTSDQVDGITSGDSPSSANPFVTVSALNSYAYVQEAPNDGIGYVRISNIWSQVSPYHLAQVGATDGQVLAWSAANSRYEPTTASGGGGLWTDGSGFIYRSGKVVIGTNVQPHATNVFFVKNINDIGNYNFFEVYNYEDSPLFQINKDRSFLFGGPTTYVQGAYTFRGGAVNGNSIDVFTIQHENGTPIYQFRTNRFRYNPTTGGGFLINSDGNNETTSLLHVRSVGNGNTQVTARFVNGSLVICDIIQEYFKFTRNGFHIGSPSSPLTYAFHYKGRYNTATPIYAIDNSSNARALEIRGNRQILMPAIPTSDPLVAGSIWNDSGTVKISAG